MKKVNFDSLKQIKTPQVWLDKAAEIPATAAEKQKAFPLYRVTAAASIALVSAIGLLIFLFFGNGDVPVAVRQSGTETAPIPAVTETVVNNPHLSPTLIEPTVPPTGAQPVTEETEIPTELSTAAAPVEQPSQNTLSPTAKPDSVSATEPTPATAAPTDRPQSADPTVSQEPTEYLPSFEEIMLSAVATFPSSMLRDDDIVYCAIYDHGELVSQGEANIYVMKNGNVFATYDTETAAEKGKIYHYAFFRKEMGGTSWGESPIFANGTITY